MITSEVTRGIYLHVVQGFAKDECPFVTDEETSAYWDKVSAEVKGLSGKGYILAIPNDVGSPWEDSGTTPEQMKQWQNEYAESRAAKKAKAGEPAVELPEPETDEAAPVDEPTMSDLMELMRAIQTGERTVEDVAAEFRTRSWPPSVTGGTPDNVHDAFLREQMDRDPDPPGAFSEVANALFRKIITIDQYAVLYKARVSATVSPDVTVTEAPAEPEAPEGEDGRR